MSECPQCGVDMRLHACYCTTVIKTDTDTPQTPNDVAVAAVVGAIFPFVRAWSEEFAAKAVAAALAPFLIARLDTARDDIAHALMVEFGGDENENPISELDADVITYRILTALTGSASSNETKG